MNARAESPKQTFLVSLAIFFCVSVCSAQSSTDAGLLKKLEQHIPQELIALSETILLTEGLEAPILILFKKAALNRTGDFDHVVAVYTNRADGILRIFRIQNETLFLLAETNPTMEVSGDRTSLDLIDINNDKRPEIILRIGGATAAHRLQVLEWTGSQIRELTPDLDFDNVFGNGFLEDLDGDGILEIITPPSFFLGGPAPSQRVGKYTVYHFNGLAYEFAFASEISPTASFDAEGNFREVYALKRRVNPDNFPLQSFTQAGNRSDGNGNITIRLGNLVIPGAMKKTPPNPLDIDRVTLVLDRSIHPLRTFIRPAEKGKADLGGSKGAGGFNGPFIELHFNRSDVLALLPQLKLTGPLEPCDVLTLEIKGKMIDGAPFRAFAPVTIIGPGGKAACEQANANRPPTRP